MDYPFLTYVNNYMSYERRKIEQTKDMIGKWGDATAMLHRIKDELWSKAKEYNHPQEEAEKIISAALKEIEQMYK